MPTFADIVGKVTSLEMEEMEEIKNIISKTLAKKKDNSILNKTSKHELITMKVNSFHLQI